MKRLCILILLLVLSISRADEKPINSHKVGKEIGKSKEKVNFLIAYKKIRFEEGNYVNDPDDRGGETYAGITRKYNPEWYGWRYITKKKGEKKIARNKHFPEAEHWVLDYYLDIWVSEGFYELTNQKIANYLFDTRIHISRKQTIRLLNTKFSLSIVHEESWVNDRLNTISIEDLRKARLQYYATLVKLRPKDEKFRRNWVIRTLRI